ncbi:MAG: DUF3090 family protein [Acidimicrobiia bacterium]|nr:DUF3090 family protein [Acidimicrobiia bacterium]
MAMTDLGPAERFAGGAIGEPGHRTFHIQVVIDGETLNFPCEKQEMAALATQSLELLELGVIELDDEVVATIAATGLELVDIDGEVFRVGGIRIGVLESGLISIELDPTEEGADGVRFLVSPEQLKAMSLIALRVVEAGRPICPRCQLPEDPEGHRCPAVNGNHR